MDRRKTRLLALILPALALGACQKQADAGTNAAAPAPTGAAVPAPAGGWTQQVAQTPEGGIRMGNPDARVKLVEYGSYTCPHCAAFDAEAMPDLRRYVASGRLSYEFRSFVRDPFDLTAALLARCGGPGSFFEIGDQLFAGQQEWIGNAQTMTPGDQQKIQALPVQQQLAQLARASGLNAFVGRRGVSAAAANRCLTDQAAQDRLIAVRDAAVQKYRIDGTPTFLLGGQVIGSFDWAQLKPKLVAAMG